MNTATQLPVIDTVKPAVVTFGVWDINFYAFLKVLLDWPASLFTWDILFLIPVPWAGPVWAPSAVSLALIGFGVAAAREVAAGRLRRVAPWQVGLAVAGGCVVVISFTLDGPSLMSGAMPAPFAWPVFVTGMGVAVAAAVAALRDAKRIGERAL